MTINNFETLGEISSATVPVWADPRKLGLYLSGRLEYLLPSAVPVDAERYPNHLLFLSPFAVANAFDPIEREIEALRFEEFPLLPSRLSALFVFSSYEDCTQAAKLHEWPLSEVREVEVFEHPLVRTHRANMHFISIMRSLFQENRPPREEERRAVWRAYWRGESEASLPIEDRRFSEPLWEWLIEGKLFRTDEQRATISDVLGGHE